MKARTATKKYSSQHGTTLLETLLATAIVGVLGSAAVPKLSDGVAQQRVRAGSSELFATFNNARSEAIRRGVAVAVAAADERDWSAGWKVYVDRNDDGVQGADEETLVERPPVADGATIRPHFGATYSGKVLSYSAEGRLRRPGGQGLVIGRLVLSLQGATRSLCFASLGVRSVAAATCD